MEIPSSAFESIRSIIKMDAGLKEKQSGRSLTFGIINRRNQSCDYSRNNWLRGDLYSALLQFGEKYVTVPFDSITVSFGTNSQFHRLKNSKGLCCTVATGEFTGGELTVGDISGSTCIFHKPVIYDFSKTQFKLEEFTGERIVLCFYKFSCKKQKELPKWDLRQERGEWVFYRGETKMGKTGIAGKKKKVTKIEGKLSIIRGDIVLSWD
jgi:hypothetical protein